MHVVVVFYVQSHEYRIAESLVVGMKKARISSVGRAVRGEIGDLLGFASGRMTWYSVEGGRKCWQFWKHFENFVLGRGKSGKFADKKAKRSSVTVTASRKALSAFRRSDILERNFEFKTKCKTTGKSRLFSCFSQIYFRASRKTLNCL